MFDDLRELLEVGAIEAVATPALFDDYHDESLVTGTNIVMAHFYSWRAVGTVWLAASVSVWVGRASSKSTAIGVPLRIVSRVTQSFSAC